MPVRVQPLWIVNVGFGYDKVREKANQAFWNARAFFGYVAFYESRIWPLSSPSAPPLRPPARQRVGRGPGVILLQLLAIALLVRAQRFFVASEFAIVKARSSQFAALTAQGNRRARG